MRPLEVLLVEDDEIDRMAVRRAFRENGIAPTIIEAGDGEEALRILHGEASKAPPRSPFVILLDINMPRMNGIEFLEQLRARENDSAIRNAVVFILSTSEESSDVARAYEHHVAGYFVKSDFREGMREIATMLKKYGELSRLP